MRIVETKVRRCGKREEGGVYLVTGEGSPEGVLPPFVELNPPIPYDVPFHRSPRLVSSENVLAELPIAEWWTGSSADAEQKKRADEWAINIFGMTTAKRLDIGECAGMDVENAIAHLTTTIEMRNLTSFTAIFKSLGLVEVNRFTKVSPHYETLHRSLVEFASTRKVDSLITMQAAIWRMAYGLPPQAEKRSEIISTLAGLLLVLGLKKDAVSLHKKFGFGG